MKLNTAGKETWCDGDLFHLQNECFQNTWSNRKRTTFLLLLNLFIA